MTAFTLYGDHRSGNCFKVKWSADYLNIDCEWIETDITKGETRTDEFLALNKFGQVPTAVFGEGESRFILTQSNSIVLYLAERANHPTFLPKNPEKRAQVYTWLFWEQNSHEPYVAGRRYRKSILGQSDDEIDKEWLPRGNAALARMNNVLNDHPFLVGDDFTAADMALVPYTRLADEGGFTLGDYPSVVSWIQRVEGLLDI